MRTPLASFYTPFGHLRHPDRAAARTKTSDGNLRVLRRRAPQTEFQGGTLEHLARVLLVNQRDATAHFMPPNGRPALANDVEHIAADAQALGLRAWKRIYSSIGAQLRLLRAALEDMTAALRGPDAPPVDVDAPPAAAAVPPARLRRVVAEYRRLKRDGRNMQFAVYIKNLEGVYDIMRGIVDVANDYEARSLSPGMSAWRVVACQCARKQRAWGVCSTTAFV